MDVLTDMLAVAQRWFSSLSGIDVYIFIAAILAALIAVMRIGGFLRRRLRRGQPYGTGLARNMARMKKDAPFRSRNGDDEP